MAREATWKCDVCGYVHRGAEPPGTCPVCGVGPELFSPFEPARVKPAKPAAGARWRCTICDYVAEGGAPPASCPVCGAPQGAFEPYTPPAPVARSRRGTDRIVVLGAGIAGLTAAEKAREVAPDAAITLVSKEPGRPYYRLNLTRRLAGEVDDLALELQPDSWFAEQRIDLLHDPRGATRIDCPNRRVELGSAEQLPYDRLVVATGAHPFVPPLPGITREGVHPLRTRQDVAALLEQAEPGLRCICIGGGLLGLEAAGALQRHGVTVTVLEGFDWLLPRQLARPAGRLLQQEVERIGIAVHCGARIEELTGDERVQAVRLEGGDELPAELVVLATGVRPNSYLARQSGLEVSRGIVVDDSLRTSDESVYAAGDVAEHRGVVYGLWPHAYAQGLVAGANAAGADLEFTGLPPSNRLKVLEQDLFSIGEFEPRDGSYCVYEQEREGRYLRLTIRDGAIVGANLFGDTSLAADLMKWVEGAIQVAELPELLDRLPDLRETCPNLG